VNVAREVLRFAFGMVASIRALRMATWLALGAMALAALAGIANAVLAFGATQAIPGLVHTWGAAPRCVPSGAWSPPFSAAFASTAMTTLDAIAFAAFVVWARQAFIAGGAIVKRGTTLAAPREVVAMWLVPFIHFFMPFWYMRGLLAACDPSDLPPVDVETKVSGGAYRQPGVVATDRWQRPVIPFRAWWALWIVTAIGSFTFRHAPNVWQAMSDPNGAAIGFHLRAAHAILTLATLFVFAKVVIGTSEIIRERARRLGV
jgi:hypothetical protein